MSDMGANVPARWQTWQCSAKMGATSFANVGPDVGDVCAAAPDPPRATALAKVMSLFIRLLPQIRQLLCLIFSGSGSGILWLTPGVAAERQAYCSVKFTSISVTTSTGAPLRSVG